MNQILTHINFQKSSEYEKTPPLRVFPNCSPMKYKGRHDFSKIDQARGRMSPLTSSLRLRGGRESICSDRILIFIRIATCVPSRQDHPKQTRHINKPLQLGRRRSPSTFPRTTSARPKDKSEHLSKDHFGPSHSPKIMNLGEGILRVKGPDPHSPLVKFSISTQDTAQRRDSSIHGVSYAAKSSHVLNITTPLLQHRRL